MPINNIHSFLVHPSKHSEEQPEINGTEIRMEGSLYRMLLDIYNRSPIECKIELLFRSDDEGQQNNEFRNLMINYIQNPNIDNGKLIAENLQKVTTKRSGLGLMFIIFGEVDNDYQIVISRFPADEGIIATELSDNLSLDFIESVFLKNTKAYKSVIYKSDSLQGGFWRGKAIDYQISGNRELSDYWIYDFLQSQLLTTGPAGTKRLANALKDAIKKAPRLDIRQELISTTSILRSRNGQTISTRQLCEQIGLSNEAFTLLEKAFERRDLMDEVFQFDLDEFNKHVLYRLVALSNGGLVIAEDDHFNEVFTQQLINSNQGIIRFTTEGKIIDEKLRKTK